MPVSARGGRAPYASAHPERHCGRRRADADGDTREPAARGRLDRHPAGSARARGARADPRGLAGTRSGRVAALAVRGPGLVQLERRGVDAVAHPRRIGAVLEDVTEVTAAPGTEDLGAPHHEAVVRARDHVLVLLRIPEARPPGPGVELGVGAEQL